MEPLRKAPQIPSAVASRNSRRNKYSLRFGFAHFKPLGSALRNWRLIEKYQTILSYWERHCFLQIFEYSPKCVLERKCNSKTKRWKTWNMRKLLILTLILTGFFVHRPKAYLQNQIKSNTTISNFFKFRNWKLIKKYCGHLFLIPWIISYMEFSILNTLTRQKILIGAKMKTFACFWYPDGYLKKIESSVKMLEIDWGWSGQNWNLNIKCIKTIDWAILTH